MTRFCVSDLHLGDRGPRDNFAHDGRESRFGEFLDFVDQEDGQLVIMGDLFDWWQVNLSRSVLAYRELMSRFSDSGATWIAGNHDNAMTGFIGTDVWLAESCLPEMVLPFENTIGGRRFLFMHGHEADPYCNSPNPGTGELNSILSGMLEDKHGPFNKRGAVEDQFVGTLEAALSLWRKIIGQPTRLEELIDGVEAYRVKIGADVVVYGHTHAPGQIGDYHYNAGSWARECDTFVRINEDGKASVWEWTRTAKAVPFDKTLR